MLLSCNLSSLCALLMFGDIFLQCFFFLVSLPNGRRDDEARGKLMKSFPACIWQLSSLYVCSILHLRWYSCCSLVSIRWRGALRQSSNLVSWRCSHGMETKERVHLGHREQWLRWFMPRTSTVLSWLSFSFNKPSSSSFFTPSVSQCFECCKIKSSWPCKTFSWPCKTQLCDTSFLRLDLLYLASSSSFLPPPPVYPFWAVFPKFSSYYIDYIDLQGVHFSIILWCGTILIILIFSEKWMVWSYSHVYDCQLLV